MALAEGNQGLFTKTMRCFASDVSEFSLFPPKLGEGRWRSPAADTYESPAHQRNPRRYKERADAVSFLLRNRWPGAGQ